MYDLILSCLLFQVAVATTLIAISAVSALINPARPGLKVWRRVEEELTLALLSTQGAPRSAAVSVATESVRSEAA